MLALGLMSGTSGDGVSCVLANFKNRKFKILAYRTFSYPKDIQEKLSSPQILKVSEISSLNFELAKIWSKVLLQLLNDVKVSTKKVSVIGSHGHTIFHDPDGKIPNTLQIGESSILAQSAGIPVVSDFRTSDIALGGCGAPLIPYFDFYFYGQGPVRAFQNIGGISNVAVVGKKAKKVLAFDTGPGNVLIDWAVNKITKGKLKFDPDGKMAKKGKIRIEIIKKMFQHSYFKRNPPKSTGKELFNENFIPRFLKANLKESPYDVLRTLTYFTAYSIALSYEKFVLPFYSLEEVVVSGGGSLNNTLMEHLKVFFYPIPVLTIENWNIPTQAKEPLAFAFFALRAMQGKINHCPEATGARSAAILGKITPVK
ncbi:MAG: anhydro-N-acetylmuramic acid kinase [Elusimicrobia bacterium]|nr:anhydro-N-acetylmuramic acid kinase [Elusimicrobiota bacterium]